MEDIDNEINDTFDLINQNIRVYKRRSGQEKKDIEETLSSLLESCKDQIKYYKKAISEFNENPSDYGGSGDFKSEVKIHKRKVRSYYDDYKEKKSKFSKLREESRKNELYAMADEHDEEEEDRQKLLDQKMMNGGDDITNEDIANELFSEVFQVQDQNAELVQNLIYKADKANEMAANINESIDMQNQQLIDISHEMDHLSGVIKRAGREVTSFMRGMATDKIFVVCCCICVCICMICVLGFIICRCYVCTLICNSLGTQAVEKCKKIPLLYYDTSSSSSSGDDTGETRSAFW